jgi:hypothetical protein
MARRLVLAASGVRRAFLRAAVLGYLLFSAAQSFAEARSASVATTALIWKAPQALLSFRRGLIVSGKIHINLAGAFVTSYGATALAGNLIGFLANAFVSVCRWSEECAAGCFNARGPDGLIKARDRRDDS